MFNPYTIQGGTATMESPVPNTNGQSRTPDFFGSTTQQAFIPTNPVTGTPMFNPTMQYPTYAQPFAGAVNPAFCGVPNYGYQNFIPNMPYNTFAPNYAAHQVNPYWQTPFVGTPYGTIPSMPTYGIPNTYYNTPFATPNFVNTPWATTNPYINHTVSPFVNPWVNPFINTTVNPLVNPAINPFVATNPFAATIPGYIPSPITPSFFRAPFVGYPHNAVAAGIPSGLYNSSPIANPLLAASIYSNPLSPFFAHPTAFAMNNPVAQLGTIAALNNIAAINGTVSPFGVNPFATINPLTSGILGNSVMPFAGNPLTSPIAAMNLAAVSSPWAGLNNPVNPLATAGVLNNPAVLASLLGSVTNPLTSAIHPTIPGHTGFGAFGNNFGVNPILANTVNPLACWTGGCL